MTRQQIYDSLVELACKTVPKINKAELQKMLSIQARASGAGGARKRTPKRRRGRAHAELSSAAQTGADGKKSGTAVTQEVKWCALSSPVGGASDPVRRSIAYAAFAASILRRVCKLSRQWGVHVSPTTFVNGLVRRQRRCGCL